jgi:hypothetical protein
MMSRSWRCAGTLRSSLPKGVLAALLAPLVGAYLYGLLLVAAVVLNGSPISPSDALLSIVTGAMLVALYGSALAYPGMVLVGLPSWFLLRRFRAEGALPYALCGFFGGFLLPPVKKHWSLLGESPLLHNAVAGALVMLVFWWIARERRVDPDIRT